MDFDQYLRRMTSENLAAYKKPPLVEWGFFETQYILLDGFVVQPPTLGMIVREVSVRRS